MYKNRGLILDRDGVINIERGYVGFDKDFTFMPGLFPFLRAMRDRGYRLAVATNQAGVARGFYGESDFAALTAHMRQGLAREGIEVELVLGCYEHPDAVSERYKRQSYWRKPNPGMVMEICRRLNLDPARSAMIGDNLTDLQAAQGGGIATCLWLHAHQETPPKDVLRVGDFNEAALYL